MSSSGQEQYDETSATRLGRRVGRLRRKLRQSQPKAEETARKALDAARPAAARAGQFVQEHEQEIKQAGIAGARIAANQATPRGLRPVVSAVSRELSKNANRSRNDDADEAERRRHADSSDGID